MEHEHHPGERPAHRSDANPEMQLLIEAGIEAARTDNRDIDPATARMIAHALAARPDSPLARFAKTDQVTNAEARKEYLPVYLDENTLDDVRELIDWLGAYLIHQENPKPQRPDRFGPVPQLGNMLWLDSRNINGFHIDLYIPGDLSPEDDQAMIERLTPLIRAHGEPFLFFLEMNDVNAADHHIGEAFKESYVGAFDSRTEILRALTELDDIENAIHDISTRFAGGEFVRIDTDGLWERITDMWIVIEGDPWYVFTK
jgi:hypothetical protein